MTHHYMFYKALIGSVNDDIGCVKCCRTLNIILREGRSFKCDHIDAHPYLKEFDSAFSSWDFMRLRDKHDDHWNTWLDLQKKTTIPREHLFRVYKYDPKKNVCTHCGCYEQYIQDTKFKCEDSLLGRIAKPFENKSLCVDSNSPITKIQPRKHIWATYIEEFRTLGELGCVHCGWDKIWLETKGMRPELCDSQFRTFEFKNRFINPPSTLEKIAARIYNEAFSIKIPESIIPSFQCYKEYTHKAREIANRPNKSGITRNDYYTHYLSKALEVPIPATERLEDYLIPFRPQRRIY